jgi:hypothetical protein
MCQFSCLSYAALLEPEKIFQIEWDSDSTSDSGIYPGDSGERELDGIF